MTGKDCEDITRRRLKRWGDASIAAHSTPAMLICVGHDERSGNLTLHVTEDTDLADAHALLLGAVALLRAGRVEFSDANRAGTKTLSVVPPDLFSTDPGGAT